MRLLLEGPDGSGKSTLAKKLSEQFGWGIKSTEGPEKYPGEINSRAARYLREHSFNNSIFDRHPCVSHPIYSRFTRVSKLDQALVDEFYGKPTFIVYCRGQPELEHEPKGYDSAAHLAAVSSNHRLICDLYDQWAVRSADVIYDFTRTPYLRILSILKGAFHV